MFKIYNKITKIYVAFVMLFFSESIYMLRHLQDCSCSNTSCWQHYKSQIYLNLIGTIDFFLTFAAMDTFWDLYCSLSRKLKVCGAIIFIT